jgi:hypothetical protein
MSDAQYRFFSTFYDENGSSIITPPVARSTGQSLDPGGTQFRNLFTTLLSSLPDTVGNGGFTINEGQTQLWKAFVDLWLGLYRSWPDGCDVQIMLALRPNSRLISRAPSSVELKSSAITSIPVSTINALALPFGNLEWEQVHERVPDIETLIRNGTLLIRHTVSDGTIEMLTHPTLSGVYIVSDPDGILEGQPGVYWVAEESLPLWISRYRVQLGSDLSAFNSLYSAYRVARKMIIQDAAIQLLASRMSPTGVPIIPNTIPIVYESGSMLHLTALTVDELRAFNTASDVSNIVVSQNAFRILTGSPPFNVSGPSITIEEYLRQQPVPPAPIPSPFPPAPTLPFPQPLPPPVPNNPVVVPPKSKSRWYIWLIVIVVIIAIIIIVVILLLRHNRGVKSKVIIPQPELLQVVESQPFPQPLIVPVPQPIIAQPIIAQPATVSMQPQPIARRVPAINEINL